MIGRLLSLLVCALSVYMCVRVLMGCWIPVVGWMAPRCSTGALVLTVTVLATQLKRHDSAEERFISGFFGSAAFLGLLVLYLVVEFP